MPPPVELAPTRLIQWNLCLHTSLDHREEGTSNARKEALESMVNRFRTSANKSPRHWALIPALLLLALGLASLAEANLSASSTLPSSNQTLERWVHATAAHLHPEVELQHPEYLALLYRQARFGNFWIQDSGQLNAAGRQLLKDLQPWLALDDHPRLKDYRQLAAWLSTPLESTLPRQRQSRDLVITDYFLSYQNDLLKRYWNQFDQNDDHGVINAYERWDGWPDEVVPSSLRQELPGWLRQLQLQSPTSWALQALESTRPDPSLYQPWRRAFDHLQTAADAGPWPQLSSPLKLGDEGDAVADLIQQLLRLGDLDALPESDLAVFDASVEAALRRFQRRHDLPRTGQVDGPTRAALNITPQEKKRRLAHNLRRLHHLPQQRHERHLMVNLANQNMQLIEQGEVSLDMKVITGRDGQRTPIMNQWLTSLVLNPIWNVPPGIARERIFPRARANPEYLASRDYALVEGWHTPHRFVDMDDLPEDAFENQRSPYRIVQKSGNYNQLGRAKFRLSNQKAIYLHDTPYRQEFNRDQRALSAGCVRVEDSDRLVKALLAPSRWTPEEVDSIYASGQERYLQVRPRVAVYLMYWTAWTDAEGRLQWREDIYQKDRFEQPRRLARQKTDPAG